MHPIEAWLKDYVGSADFAAALERDIAALEDPKQAVAVRMALLDYVTPKVKDVEPALAPIDRVITINYVVADAVSDTAAAVPDGDTD